MCGVVAALHCTTLRCLLLTGWEGNLVFSTGACCCPTAKACTAKGVPKRNFSQLHPQSCSRVDAITGVVEQNTIQLLPPILCSSCHYPATTLHLIYPYTIFRSGSKCHRGAERQHMDPQHICWRTSALGPLQLLGPPVPEALVTANPASAVPEETSIT